MQRHSEFRYGFVLLTALLSIAIGRPALADDWPQVRRDPLGSGVTATALPDELTQLWTYRAGKDAAFDATAVIAGGVIYVGDDAGTFHAVRLADGQPVWTKEFGEDGFVAGAAIDGDHLYAGDMAGLVRCLAIADGAEIWTANLEAEVFAGPTPIAGGVLVTCEAGTLACLDAADGHERWRFHIEAPLRCSPTINAGRVMLAGCDSQLHIIDISDGHEIGTVAIDGPTGSTPAMHGERVYFGTESGTFYAIDVPIDVQKPPAVAWTFKDPQRGQSIRSAAAVTDDLVVFGSQGKSIYGLDPASGEPKWKPLPTRNRIESSPVVAGERVVAATTGGKLVLLNAATGETIWEFDAGGSFTASPAVVDGRLVIGNSNATLYCFGAQGTRKKE